MEKPPIETIKSKDEARQLAIDWQTSWQDHPYSYEELFDWQQYFYSLAKKFNLIREFKENGIL
jgi:hypothetical protein